MNIQYFTGQRMLTVNFHGFSRGGSKQECWVAWVRDEGPQSQDSWGGDARESGGIEGRDCRPAVTEQSQCGRQCQAKGL